MLPEDFYFELPAELIAQSPLPERSASRLLCLPASDSGVFPELGFADIGELLRPGDLLVLNNTRVIPARLHGRKTTGGQVEVLLERVLEETVAQVQMRASKAPVRGSVIDFPAGAKANVEAREGRFYRLRFTVPVMELLERHGHMPLPPYITREDSEADRERYQTVYAADPGAVAAPTAGLHFDAALLHQLRERGVNQAFVTLHVGAGTFLPLQEEQLQRGELHRERVIVSATTCAAIETARARGGRIIAVGTTVVRALETAAASGSLTPFAGETSLFIRPGFRFQVVDALITNFHLPASSLLMLVAAFAGTGSVMAAYRQAVAQRFRFYSYGDAMFVERHV